MGHDVQTMRKVRPDDGTTIATGAFEGEFRQGLRLPLVA
jgi:hypothetical protein